MDPTDINYFPYFSADGPVDTPITADQGLRRGTMTHAQARAIYEFWGIEPERYQRSLDTDGYS